MAYHHVEPHNHRLSASAEASAPIATAFRTGRAYKVRGLDCAEEVAVLKQAVGPLVGGADRLAFDVLNGRMTVAANEREVADEAIFKAIAATGMWAAIAADTGASLLVVLNGLRLLNESKAIT